MAKQRTIAKDVSLSGIGLHTGQKTSITFKPAPANAGIFFMKNGVKITPDASKVSNTVRGTTIGEGENAVNTVEHLLAAFVGMGIDNICVEITADEPPIGDGSAMPFVKMIEEAGIVEQDAEKKYYTPSMKISYSDNEAKVEALPSGRFKVTAEIEYDHPLIRRQRLEIIIDEEVFKKEIAPAKTYCFDYEIEQLEAIGLAKGGSLKNAIVIGEKGIHNKEMMTFEDEFVRHKILDLMGDLYLIGRPVKADITSFCGGHTSNTALAKLFAKDIEMTGGGVVPEYPMELDLEGVKSAIPHRPPFLFVDSVTITEEAVAAVGRRLIRPDEWFFKGHFPERPVLPGVLITEALAQTACVLLLSKPDWKGKLPFFMGINNVKFRRPVNPGDELILKVEIIRPRMRGGKAAGQAYVGDALVCECEFSFSLVDKE
ncbi:MAG: UDP-3-O-[3-hydroxymyristoyl] N-acetylglucosamine deacetylase [Elusimicrobia bacterium HGW-Elusimicrobia-2]|nr:MAG: UDP-3-O-[3-hydroxymyristoyl] N-acetylglucosamine deacetylase [Elusimicrobia bacterium HGW-Elusimicrobia-2]